MLTKYFPKFIFLFFLTLGLPSSGQTTTWTGGTNTDWGTATNWNNGVPDNLTNVTINNTTNPPIIGATTGASVKDLTIDEPDGLTILGGGSLIVTGTQYGVGLITYTRTLSTNWHLVASPVVGQFYDDTWVSNNGIDTSGAGNNIGIAAYIT